jgi:hypothetical protein
MNNDNAKGGAEPSLASAGSQPVAYEIHWKGQDGKYLAKPYLVFANEQPSEHWTPAPLRFPLYRSPALTDEEREAVRGVADFVSELADFPVADETKTTLKKTATTLRSMLERTK